MQDDLEDFLARAAKRRADKANRQRGEEIRSESRRINQEIQSQYSDSRSERVVKVDDYEEEIFEAELVGEDLAQAQMLSSGSSEHPSTGLDRETSRLKQIKSAEANSRSIHQNVKSASKSSLENPKVEKSRSRDHVTGIHSLELVQMLSRPGGIRQAFLLKEIIDRPLHRWK